MSPKYSAPIRAACEQMGQEGAILIATDNDAGGQELADRIEAIAREIAREDLHIVQDLPEGEGSDWNDRLRATPSPVVQAFSRQTRIRNIHCLKSGCGNETHRATDLCCRLCATRALWGCKSEPPIFPPENVEGEISGRNTDPTWFLVQVLPGGRGMRTRDREESAREILDRRYASGEISQEEYQRMRKDLE